MLTLAPDRRHFVNGDGRAVLWLGDTAWNGVLNATDDQWAEYLALRKSQRFNVIQFVTTQWRGCSSPPIGRPLQVDGDRATINEEAFATLDRRIAMIADHGLTPAPIMFWAIGPRDVGQLLREEDLVRIGREMVQRWKAHRPIWLLAGDGMYESVADRWRRIGRGIFSDAPNEIASMHPGGRSWVGELFANEPWYSVVGIQSGHGKAAADLEFLLRGPWTRQWHEIAAPFVNLEPNYEGHPAYGTQEPFEAYHVRRAAYWSLLRVPPAGVTYGNNEIWNWLQQRGPSENHKNLPDVGPWSDGLRTPGIASMTVMQNIFDRLNWTALRPAQQLLADQPGEDDLNRYIAVATSEAGQSLAYLPVGGELSFTNAPTGDARWIDPRSGDEQVATGRAGRFAAPSDEDWLLAIG